MDIEDVLITSLIIVCVFVGIMALMHKKDNYGLFDPTPVSQQKPFDK